jgi:alkylation response protein AidB-like acyl-CoA dehydrogenase
MDLELSEDQFALRDGIHAMLAGRFDHDRVSRGFDRDMFAELTEAGVFSLIADGFTWSDAVVVFEQLGMFCVPGPLVASALAADGLVTGAVERRDPVVVEHLDALDALFVFDHDGVCRVDASTLGGAPSDWPLDPLSPVTTVHALARGDVIGDAGTASELRNQGAALTAAFALGIASHLADASVAYAKQREQFDRPIGSFQAIKHMLADMAVRTEVARAAVYAAGAHLDADDVPGLDRAVSVAKALAGEAAVVNGKAATQVHGGMGFTWEVAVHLYLKRAWVLDTHFGSAAAHCDAAYLNLLG